LRQDRWEAIRVFHLHHVLAEAGAQPVTAGVVEGALEQAGGIGPRELVLFALADRDDATRVRQEYTHHGLVVLSVWPEIMERIGMPSGDDLAGKGRELAHGIAPRCCKIRKA